MMIDSSQKDVYEGGCGCLQLRGRFMASDNVSNFGPHVTSCHAKVDRALTQSPRGAEVHLKKCSKARHDKGYPRSRKEDKDGDEKRMELMELMGLMEW